MRRAVLALFMVEALRSQSSAPVNSGTAASATELQARLVLEVLSASPPATEQRVAVLDELLQLLDEAVSHKPSLAGLRGDIAEQRYQARSDIALAIRALDWAEQDAARWRTWFARLTACIADAESTDRLETWLRHLQDPRITCGDAGREHIDLSKQIDRVIEKHATGLESHVCDLAQCRKRLQLDLQPAIDALTVSARTSTAAYATLLKLAGQEQVAGLRSDSGMPKVVWTVPATPTVESVFVLSTESDSRVECSRDGFTRLKIAMPRGALLVRIQGGGTAIMVLDNTRPEIRVPVPGRGEVVIVDKQHEARTFRHMTRLRLRELTGAGIFRDATIAQCLQSGEDPCRLAPDKDESFRKALGPLRIAWPDDWTARRIETDQTLAEALGLRPGERLLRASRMQDLSATRWLVVEVIKPEQLR